MGQMLEALEASLVPIYHYKLVTNLVVPGLLISPPEVHIYLLCKNHQTRNESERPDMYESLNSKFDLAI